MAQGPDVIATTEHIGALFEWINGNWIAHAIDIATALACPVQREGLHLGYTYHKSTWRSSMI